MQTRQVTVLDSGETGGRTSDLRNTTFEGGEAHDFRFRTVTVLNGEPSPAVDGTAEAAEAEGPSRDAQGTEEDQFTAGGPVLFPSLHMRRLVQAARAGQTTMSAKVFDGSDDGRKVYDTLAVIGRRATARASASAIGSRQAAARGRDGRRAALAVTPELLHAGEGERTPIYTLTFDLYENGVSGALKLDYGDFAILGDMTRLEMDKAYRTRPALPEHGPSRRERGRRPVLSRNLRPSPSSGDRTAATPRRSARA